MTVCADSPQCPSLTQCQKNVTQLKTLVQLNLVTTSLTLKGETTRARSHSLLLFNIYYYLSLSITITIILLLTCIARLI